MQIMALGLMIVPTALLVRNSVQILCGRTCATHLKWTLKNSLLRTKKKNFPSYFTRAFSSCDNGYAVQCGEEKLQVVNSLSQRTAEKKGTKKEPLILMKKNVAYWYACGPTVYDSAHLGHASSFVRFDIIQRILSEFFQTHVVMAMGITDIDDKIIQRAQERNVGDFREISRHYEEEFYSDMQQLNVLPATVYVRVSDHIPQIISFVRQIIKNGYGYTTPSGSVYFDVEAFSLARYNKLSPHAMDVQLNTARQGMDAPSVEKRNAKDFVLWKGAKPGEPWWDAPWGKGRPGWHIECSAMSSAIFGNRLDIHTGGKDLAFPHHNNEIAQCEACFNSNQWANYFLHSGHLFLRSDANKMSKSLQNVVNIREFLETFTANQFRVLCLMTKYNYDIEYSPDVMKQAVSLVNQMSAFLNDADAYVQGKLSCQPFNEADLLQRLSETQQEVIKAFADDFDTKRALDSIMRLIQFGNTHFSQPAEDTSTRSPGPVAAVSTYISRTLTNLGLTLNVRSSVQSDHSSQVMTTALDTLVGFRQTVRRWALTLPEHDGIASVSQASHGPEMDSAGRKAVMKERAPLLEACDHVRDTLTQNGVQIKDRGPSATWEFVEKKKAVQSHTPKTG